MVRLETRFQAFEDLDGFRNRWFSDIDFLKATCQRVIFLEDAAVFRVSRRPDAFELTGRQRRLQEIGRIERPARSRARANEGMNFIDEQNGVRVIHQLLQHRFQALLEIAAIFCAGEQCAHVERIDLRLGEDVRDLAVNHALGQAFGNGGLAHASFTDEQWIILAATAEDLDHALKLFVTPDQRIDLAIDGHLVEVLRETLQCAPRFATFRVLGFGFFLLPAGRCRF